MLKTGWDFERVHFTFAPFPLEIWFESFEKKLVVVLKGELDEGYWFEHASEDDIPENSPFQLLFDWKLEIRSALRLFV